MSIWLPGFTRDDNIRGAGGGTYLPAAPCGVIHTTEGSAISSAQSVYRQKMVAPHCTVDPVRRIRLQHIPLDRSAYALVNAAGGVETNRHGARQVEVVGFAGRMHDLPDDQLEWLATEVVGPISAAVDITGPGLKQYGEGAGWILASPSARQRLSFAAWTAFSGWCGHQNVPENSHWDPGALDLPRIVQIAYQGEDDLTRDELDDALVEADERAKAREAAMVDAVVDDNRKTRRMLLDVVDAVSAASGVDPAKVRARLKPETLQALDRVD